MTVEEHSIIGGLGGAVAEVLAEQAPTKMLRIGVNDTFGESGPAKALIEREDVYYVQEAGADMSWLGRYYEEMGVKISVERAEAVGDAFEIYRLRRA